MVSPPPPSESETTASLNSLENRLDTLENLSISSRLSSIEANYVTTDTNQTLTGTKTLKSNLDLNPPTVNSNTGGQINFHYNQASSATSSIYENQSGRIRLDGNLEVVHTVTGYESISTANGNSFRVTRPLNTGIRPITNYNGAERWDMPLVYVNATDGKVLSSIYTPFRFASSSDYRNAIQLLAYNPLVENEFDMLGIGYNQNGAYTHAPTPATTDNSGQIATTAWVMNRLGTYYKDLGDNYVMNIADFDKMGVMYHIGSLSTETTINYPSGNNNGDWAMYCFRADRFTTLLGVTPRSTKLFYATFWSGNFNGWRVFEPVSVSS